MFEEKLLLGPLFFVSYDKACNVDHLSHVCLLGFVSVLGQGPRPNSLLWVIAPTVSIIIFIKLISLKFVFCFLFFFLGHRLILRSYTFQFRFLALSHMNEVDLSWLPLKRRWSGLLSSLLGQDLYNVVTTYLIGKKKSS